MLTNILQCVVHVLHAIWYCVYPLAGRHVNKQTKEYVFHTHTWIPNIKASWLDESDGWVRDWSLHHSSSERFVLLLPVSVTTPCCARVSSPVASIRTAWYIAIVERAALKLSAKNVTWGECSPLTATSNPVSPRERFVSFVWVDG